MEHSSNRFISSLFFIIGACMIGSAYMYYFLKIQKKSTFSQAEKIYKVLDGYRITYDIDAHSVDKTSDTTPKPIIGVPGCIDQIFKFVEAQQPVNMLVVGFPYKLPNHERKTIGDLPDMAERKSLEYLQEMLSAIKSIYSPGAQLTIFCDGVAFAEFFGVHMRTVVAYENALKKLVTDLPDITLYTSADSIKDHAFNSCDDINRMFDSYGPSGEELKNVIKPVLEVARKRFALELDCEAGRTLLKQKSLDDIVISLLSREARMRTYLSEQFPTSQFLRLTFHFSADVSKKFGIKTSPYSDITPYHGVLVEDDDSWSLEFKKDVDIKRYELITKKINGINCPYFKRKKNNDT